MPSQFTSESCTTGSTPTDDQVWEFLCTSFPNNIDLTALKGFKVDFSGNIGFRKFFFAARCHCGTVALLSVELDRDKTVEDVKRAVPELSKRLQAQAKRFANMPCDLHQKMRRGPVTDIGTDPGPLGRE